MLARRFFFVSLGILALATAYHLGSRSVEAQGTNTVAAGYTITASNMLALTHNGDLWFTQNGGDPGNPNNYPWTFGGNIFTGPGTDVPQSQPGPASESSILEPARPNPFGLATEIAFTLDTEGVTEISVYSPSGQLVRRLVDERIGAGPHTLAWDGRDDAGRSLASGTYVYQLRVNGRVVGSEKAVVLR